jgi:hypothetical protein
MSDAPHAAEITFNITVRQMRPDGSLEGMPVENKELVKNGISNVAKLVVSGYNLEDCITKVKQKLEKLNG